MLYLEPYQQWNKKQLENELTENTRQGSDAALDKPLHQDTVMAAGREWSQAEKLGDLQRVNEYLWDHPPERIPLDDYKKLVSWIKEKEAAQRQAGKSKEAPEAEKEASPKKDKDKFEHNGKEYTKNDSYEKLTGLKPDLPRCNYPTQPVSGSPWILGIMQSADRRSRRWPTRKQATDKINLISALNRSSRRPTPSRPSMPAALRFNP